MGTPNREIGLGPVDPPDYEVQFDYRDDYDSMTIAIVEAVADVRDVSVTDIVPPLSDVVDPSALERIFRPVSDDDRRRGWVTFFLCDCRVIVSSDGWIRVYGPDDE